MKFIQKNMEQNNNHDINSTNKQNKEELNDTQNSNITNESKESQVSEFSNQKEFVPTAGYSFLMRLYDPIVRITCREKYFKKKMIQIANIKPNYEILDVCCGTGTLLLLINSKNNCVR
jgi:2-polyprenyl-3-methyl-5-hydroxy-6-metoxy-1,4-benzoquinol methylase